MVGCAGNSAANFKEPKKSYIWQGTNQKKKKQKKHKIFNALKKQTKPD